MSDTRKSLEKQPSDTLNTYSHYRQHAVRARVRKDQKPSVDPSLRLDRQVVVKLQPFSVTGLGRGGNCPVFRYDRTASSTAATGWWPRCVSVRNTLISTAWVSAPSVLPLA